MAGPLSGAWRLAALLLAASLAGCPRAAPEAGVGSGGAAAATAAAAPAPVTRLTLASVTAFDLTVSDRGALLAWAESTAPGALHLRRFAVNGERAPAPPAASTLPPASGAADLTLVEAPSGIALLWRTPGEPAEVRGLWLGPAGTAQPLALGPTWSAPSGARGNLALAVRGEGALALVRGPREACRAEAAAVSGAGGGAAGGEHCFGFRFHQLSPLGAQAVGLGLHVPVPCDARAALLLSAPGSAEQRYHYAVCTRLEGETVLTAFSIEPARSYAAAQQVLPRCQPLGAGLFAGQPTFVGECGAARRLARFVDADAPFALQSGDIRGLVCNAGNAGAPRVRLGEGWLDLTGPQAQLELLLDAQLSPPGSRAVWTGEVLLVARAAADGQLALERYGCAGKELVHGSIALE